MARLTSSELVPNFRSSSSSFCLTESASASSPAGLAASCFSGGGFFPSSGFGSALGSGFGASSTFFPQLGQNFAPGLRGALQSAQVLGTIFAPQPVQNFA